MARLTGQVAVVTGAALGPRAALGSAIARTLAREGASVIAADLQDCQSLVDLITEDGGVAHAAQVDVSNEESVAALFATATLAYGTVDILVNNAALGSNAAPVPLAELSVATWDAIMAVNVRGPFLCARAAAPAMRATGNGKILNIGSATVLEGLPQRLAYVTSKGALHAMTRALARELGPFGVRVNTIAPGLVTNPSVVEVMAARPGALEAIRQARSVPEDLSVDSLLETVVFLASRDSDAISGQCLVVDNGALFV